ncbi:MAG: hypothetical protein HKP27_10775 [Myxococcales bacterium]|nr:hypothetical protein [Myxococcales bacterium]
MIDRPTASELLDTIAEVLEGDILPELEGASQHKVRVAANLCRILEREFRLGPGTALRERAALRELLGADDEQSAAALNQTLCERLRSGGDPSFEAATLRVLRTIARDKLSIAKPGHDSYDFAAEASE